MDRTFTIAGVSTSPEGVKTYRFANGKLNLRANTLRHFGHTSIELMELPREMTKVQAISWLMTHHARLVKGAVVPTRAADKTAENELLLEARRKAEGIAKARATRAARREKAVA
jgi:hypothetical protein